MAWWPPMLGRRLVLGGEPGLIEGFESLCGMERLATVRRVWCEDPEAATNVGAAARRVHEWSRRKRLALRNPNMEKTPPHSRCRRPLSLPGPGASQPLTHERPLTVRSGRSTMPCNQRAMAGAAALLPPAMRVLSRVPRGWTWFPEALRLRPHGFSSPAGSSNTLSVRPARCLPRCKRGLAMQVD